MFTKFNILLTCLVKTSGNSKKLRISVCSVKLARAFASLGGICDSKNAEFAQDRNQKLGNLTPPLLDSLLSCVHILLHTCVVIENSSSYEFLRKSFFKDGYLILLKLF